MELISSSSTYSELPADLSEMKIESLCIDDPSILLSFSINLSMVLLLLLLSLSLFSATSSNR
jgi:hypothetical protein